MPDLFYKRLRRMRIYDYFETIAVLLILGCLIIATGVISSRTSLAIVLYLIAIFISAALWLCYRKVTKSGNQQEPYFISLENISKDVIISRVNAKRIDDHSFFCIVSGGRISARTLILYDTVFDAKNMRVLRRNANSHINKICNSPSSVPLYEALTKLRINLVVAEHETDELVVWVNKNANHLMRRTEGIINAAIVLDRQMLIFPALYGAFSKIQLDKYLFSAEVLLKNVA